MRYLRYFRYAMVAGLLSAFVAATPSASLAADYKIAVLVPQRLLAQTKAGQEAADRLKAKKEAAQQQLDAKANEIKDMQEDLSKRVMLLSEDERAKAREEFERQQRDAKRMKEDLERELQRVEAQVLGEVNELLSDVVIAYGKDNGYDMIIDASATLYFSDKPDITALLIKAADAAYKKK